MRTKYAKYTDHKVRLIRCADGSVRIAGGALDDVEVLAWQPPDGRKLVYMNEVGEINVDDITGLVLVRFADLQEFSTLIAMRAAVTNSTDLAASLAEWNARRWLTAPENVWLGVMVAPDAHYHSSDLVLSERPLVTTKLPEWALGHVLVEEEKPHGCFGALGYAREEQLDSYRSSAEGWYFTLLVDEFGTVDPVA
jgi:hypothetical protein